MDGWASLDRAGGVWRSSSGPGGWSWAWRLGLLRGCESPVGRRPGSPGSPSRAVCTSSPAIPTSSPDRSLSCRRLTAPAGHAGSYAIGVVALQPSGCGGSRPPRAHCRAARPSPARRPRCSAEPLCSVSWSELAGYGHLDDALCSLTAISVVFLGDRHRRVARRWGRARSRHRDQAVGCDVPAAGFRAAVTRALAPRGDGRGRCRRAGLGAVCRRRSKDALAARLGARSSRTTPDSPCSTTRTCTGPMGARRAGLRVESCLVGFAVWRGADGQAALIAAIAFRVLIDPATWSYYTAGSSSAPCVWDLLGSRRVVPVWTTRRVPLAGRSHAARRRSRPTRGWFRMLACLAASDRLFGRAVPDAAPPSARDEASTASVGAGCASPCADAYDQSAACSVAMRLAHV